MKFLIYTETFFRGIDRNKVPHLLDYLESPKTLQLFATLRLVPSNVNQRRATGAAKADG